MTHIDTGTGLTVETRAESVEEFRLRARDWLARTLPRREAGEPADPADEEVWVRTRELQATLHEAGFAGICFPTEYGGQGLGSEYQQAFTEESLPYEMPRWLNLPTLSICLPTILDVGTEEQKRRHIGACLRGESIMVQFLSEPGGGSDLAGLSTRAVLDGDEWVLTGAKTWSTLAFAADWALCLARTDWDVPKHAGLTMFLVPTRAPGVTMNRIRMVDGSAEFCEEFFDEVRLPADSVLGAVGDGWAVAARQLFHERNAVGGGSPYVSGGPQQRKVATLDPVEVALRTGRAGDPVVRERIGRWLALTEVKEQVIARVSAAIGTGALPPAASSMLRLISSEQAQAGNDLKLEIAGGQAVVGSPDDASGGLAQDVGLGYLMRQGISMGGGTTEISRNIVSERLLGMPREPAADRDVPFNQVRRSRR